MVWYQKRVEMGGFREEVFVSLLRLGQLAAALEVHHTASQQWTVGNSLAESAAVCFVRECARAPQ
jgi:hypothetical protein